MAKLARRLAEGRWRITIRGQLGAGDLLRLERTCAPALEQYPIPLAIEVDQVTAVDEPARLFLRRLLDRGAVLVGKSGEPAGQIVPGSEQRDSE